MNMKHKCCCKRCQYCSSDSPSYTLSLLDVEIWTGCHVPWGGGVLCFNTPILAGTWCLRRSPSNYCFWELREQPITSLNVTFNGGPAQSLTFQLFKASADVASLLVSIQYGNGYGGNLFWNNMNTSAGQCLPPGGPSENTSWSSYDQRWGKNGRCVITSGC